MASLAELMYSGVSGQQQQLGQGLAQAVGTGMELALKQEQLGQQREELKAKQEQLGMARDGQVLETLKLAQSTKDPRMRQFLLQKVLPAKMTANGSQLFTPESTELLTKSNEALDKAIGLQMQLEGEVAKGTISAAKAFEIGRAILKDPEAIARLDTNALVEAERYGLGESHKNERAKAEFEREMLKQGRTFAQQTSEKEAERGAAAQQEWVKKTADAEVTYTKGGGKAAAQRSIDAMEKAIEMLKNGEVNFGNWVKTKIPGATSDFAMRATDKTGSELLSLVRSSISIRDRLADPNPTEAQVNRVLNYLIDPSKSNEFNIANLQAELKQIKSSQAERLDAFKRAKLPGYENSKDGKAPSFIFQGKPYTREQLESIRSKLKNPAALKRLDAILASGGK